MAFKLLQIAGIPAGFMAVMTIWAVVMNQTKFGTQHNLLLQVINGIILVLAVWIVIEGVIKLFSPSETGADGATPETT